jgi:hypothetical protein
VAVEAPPSPAPPSPVPEFVHAPDLLTVELPPLRWLIDPFVVAGEGITFLHGRWGSFKTPIAYAMGAAVATGRPLWGLPVERGRVLFLQVDTPRRVFFERARDLAGLYGVLDDPSAVYDLFLGYPGLDLLKAHLGEGTAGDREMHRKLKELHARHHYDLVVVDSLRPLHTRPDTDSEVPPMVYRAVQQTFPGASVVLIHHDRKSQADETEDQARESFSGSQAWANHATISLKIKRTSDTKEVTLFHHKSQAGPTLETPLQLVMVGNLATAEIDVIAGLEGSGLKGRALDAAIAEALGVTDRTARRRRTGLGTEPKNRVPSPEGA